MQYTGIKHGLFLDLKGGDFLQASAKTYKDRLNMSSGVCKTRRETVAVAERQSKTVNKLLVRRRE